MPRWIAYDPAVKHALAHHMGITAESQPAAGAPDVVTAVMSAGGAAMALLPAAHGSVQVVTRRPLTREPAHAAPPRGYEATGFLGLHDEPVFDDEPPPPRSWWEKLWE
jgi:hypothetical protein